MLHCPSATILDQVLSYYHISNDKYQDFFIPSVLRLGYNLVLSLRDAVVAYKINAYEISIIACSCKLEETDLTTEVYSIIFKYHLVELIVSPDAAVARSILALHNIIKSRFGRPRQRATVMTPSHI